jgi:hypothetical protein
MMDLVAGFSPLDKEAATQHLLDTILCPGTIPVFALEDQQWILVRIDHLAEADWVPETYNRLVLDERKKEGLLKLTQAHAKYKDVRSNDMIKGKKKE